ncbi:diguanylate cyclase [Cohnella endophytica]|uniref:Diguanylate cyclase n=2 Tax=Cohnella endophytica TaxID=2419778 RepID=A0A494XBE5_9BACL|nr:diguanylate cyclase [Cohnella endophytica]
MEPQDKITAKVLVVDDRAENLFAMETILKQLDCEVYTGRSGNEALSLTLRNDFALILLDVNMPDMDGFEVAELLRGNEATCRIPIIFVTAINKEDRSVFRGYLSGAVDYLLKPVDPDILLSKVKVFLELHLKRKELEAIKAKLDEEIEQRKAKEIELLESNEKLEQFVVRLQQASDTDGLTLVANRRCFDRTLDKEFELLKRRHFDSSNGLPLSLILLDVDQFKKYNDNYGHMEGDHCLREVAKALSRAVNRPSDLVARYGGEEFVALLPDTALSDAVHIAERMRQEVETLRLPHAFSDASPFVTVSLGVSAIVPQEGANTRSLIERADQAMYQAKMAGRNRVLSSEDVLHV